MKMLKVSFSRLLRPLLPASALIAQDDNEVIEEAKSNESLGKTRATCSRSGNSLFEAEDLEVVAALEATSLVNLQEAKAQAEQRLQAALDTNPSSGRL